MSSSWNSSAFIQGTVFCVHSDVSVFSSDLVGSLWNLEHLSTFLYITMCRGGQSIYDWEHHVNIISERRDQVKYRQEANNQQPFSNPKLYGMSHAFFCQFVCYLLNAWSDTLASNTDQVYLGFFPHWALQTLHFNIVHKNIVQWIFWFKIFDKITRYKYFHDRKHKTRLHFRLQCFTRKFKCCAIPSLLLNCPQYSRQGVCSCFFLCIKC